MSLTTISMEIARLFAQALSRGIHLAANAHTTKTPLYKKFNRSSSLPIEIEDNAFLPSFESKEHFHEWKHHAR